MFILALLYCALQIETKTHHIRFGAHACKRLKVKLFLNYISELSVYHFFISISFLILTIFESYA